MELKPLTQSMKSIILLFINSFCYIFRPHNEHVWKFSAPPPQICYGRFHMKIRLFLSTCVIMCVKIQVPNLSENQILPVLAMQDETCKIKLYQYDNSRKCYQIYSMYQFSKMELGLIDLSIQKCCFSYMLGIFYAGFK